MVENDIDPWQREELTSVRHAGTLYAGGIALLVVLLRDEIASGDVPNLIRAGAALLLMGVFGSIGYQLTTIQVRSKYATVMRMSSAGLLVAGAFGFVLFAISLIFA